MTIQTNATDRKKLAKSIAEFTGNEIHYMGPPTFAYAVGNYIIDRAGVITSESEEGEAELRTHLETQGFLDREITELAVSVPLMDMDAEAMKRLVFMLHSKQYLLNKAVGLPCFAVSEALVEALENNPPADKAAFIALCAEHESKGIAFDDEKVTITFASTGDTDKDQAFTYLVPIMVTKAKEAKRISPKELKPENEKYYSRTWLIQLGLGGSEPKAYRNTLMAGLKGHSAFRTDEAADKFKADQKAKRAAKKAAELESEDE